MSDHENDSCHNFDKYEMIKIMKKLSKINKCKHKFVTRPTEMEGTFMYVCMLNEIMNLLISKQTVVTISLISFLRIQHPRKPIGPRKIYSSNLLKSRGCSGQSAGQLPP